VTIDMLHESGVKAHPQTFNPTIACGEFVWISLLWFSSPGPFFLQNLNARDYWCVSIRFDRKIDLLSLIFLHINIPVGSRRA
jgi:hypothetical protein